MNSVATMPATPVSQALKGFRHTDVGLIPADWMVRKVGDVCRLINGRGFKPHEWRTAGLPIIRIQNLNGSDEFNHFDGSYNRKIEVHPGQLLFAWSGSRGTSFGPHIWKGTLGVLNYHTWKVVADTNSVSQAFLYHALKGLTAFIEGEAHGASALVHVQKWQMEGFQLALPPTTEEQAAIAEALSDADALIESLESLIAKKRAIKQGAMQELLSGRRRLPGFSGAREMRRLGDVASFYKGRGLPKSQISDSGAEPCIHYGQLFTTYPATIKDILSRTDYSSGAARSIANDVLMPTSDVTPRGLAKASCVTVDDVVLGGDILIIRPDSKLIWGAYLSSCIRYEEAQVLQLVTGSTVFHLYASDMKTFTFAVPPLREQMAIAELLTDMDDEVVELEQRREKARQIKQGMMQELLTGRVRLV